MLLDTSRSMWPVTPVGVLILSLTRKLGSSSSSAWLVTHPAPCKPSKPVSRPSLASGQPSGLNSDTGLFFIYITFYDNCPEFANITHKWTYKGVFLCYKKSNYNFAFYCHKVGIYVKKKNSLVWESSTYFT